MGTPSKLFQKIFLKQKHSEKVSTSDAILKIKCTEEQLTKKSDFLESKINAELQIARENGGKNKRLALQALKRKRRYEKSLQQIDNTLTTLEQQRESLENAESNVEVLKALRFSAGTLQGMHKTLNADDTCDIMDEVGEQIDAMDEINSLLASPSSPAGQQYDEDELLRELELMEKEHNKEPAATLINAPATPKQAPWSSPNNKNGEKSKENRCRTRNKVAMSPTF